MQIYEQPDSAGCLYMQGTISQISGNYWNYPVILDNFYFNMKEVTALSCSHSSGNIIQFWNNSMTFLIIWQHSSRNLKNTCLGRVRGGEVYLKLGTAALQSSLQYLLTRTCGRSACGSDLWECVSPPTSSGFEGTIKISKWCQSWSHFIWHQKRECCAFLIVFNCLQKELSESERNRKRLYKWAYYY